MATQATNKRRDERSNISRGEDRNDDGHELEGLSKEVEAPDKLTDHEDAPRIDDGQGKDLETADNPSSKRADMVANEDYSVFTVGQKRAIVLAGSYIAWFSPVSQG